MKKTSIIAALALTALVGCDRMASKVEEGQRASLSCGAVQYNAVNGSQIPDTILALCKQVIDRDGEVAKAQIELCKQQQPPQKR